MTCMVAYTSNEARVAESGSALRPGEYVECVEIVGELKEVGRKVFGS